MDKAIEVLKTLAKLFLVAAETGLALIALILIVYLLLGGDSGDYVTSVVANIGLLVSAITPQAIITLGLVFGLLGYLRSR